jgi:uncharacterized membrane protein YoaK (UPF0700 family)
MFRHRLGEKVQTKTYFDWFLLSFLAGAVNAGGFIACQRFVSHVTGFATLAGVDMAQMRYLDGFGMLTVPLYFLGGVMISAYLIDRRIGEGKKPRYDLAMAGVFLCLTLAGVGGWLEWFGEFTDAMAIQQDYGLLALLCMASGLQNAALTSSSGATVRTTHLTGVTTDLGIGLVRAASLRSDDPRRGVEARAAGLRVGTILSFMFGGGLGALVFLRFEYLGFLLPAALALYAFFVSREEIRSLPERGGRS